MSGRFVRSSKYRHVFGTPAKKEKCFCNVRISKGAHESEMSAVNCKFIAVIMESQGGGKFIVIPIDKVGRVDINHPTVTGHKSAVLDVAWNPFDDYEIASASEDCEVKLWSIPEGGLKESMTEPTLTLRAHQKKVLHLRWHPSASNVLASAAADNVIIIWNTETGEQLAKTEPLPDMMQSICWNYDGSKIALTCKDKKIRVMNARTGAFEKEASGHLGTKPSRVVYCGKFLFTSGFSRSSERQYALWNPDNLDKPLCIENIDSSSGVLFPYWDEGTKMVYLVGKGDTQFRYFEVSEEDGGKVFFLSMYQTTVPARSVCSMPKRHVDYMKCEVMKFFRILHTKGDVEPLSMTVPRKSDMFQEDIYPPCPAGVPALTADEWVGGTNKDPVLMKINEGATTVKGPAKKKVEGTEPSTLEEYRKAYKSLLEENKKLKKQLGM